MTKTPQDRSNRRHGQAPSEDPEKARAVDLERLAASVASSLRIAGIEISPEVLLERHGPDRK